MPTEKSRADYMRDYRARKKAVEREASHRPQGEVTEKSPIEEVKHVVVSPIEKLPEHVTKKSPFEPGEIPQKQSSYKCECRPGLKCTSHAIAALNQKTRDFLLERINVHKGKPAQK